MFFFSDRKNEKKEKKGKERKELIILMRYYSYSFENVHEIRMLLEVAENTPVPPSSLHDSIMESTIFIHFPSDRVCGVLIKLLL